MKWKVVPICDKQMRDVNPSDVLNNGLYRRCDVYKGGGYDIFPAIYNKRNPCNKTDLANQFVVQLYGCPLNCPYCYVTRRGIFGRYTKVSTTKILRDFRQSGLKVFHLMGGAPAIYINDWKLIISKLSDDEVFRSDLLLVEGEYDENVLAELAQYKNTLYAISIKGVTWDELRVNTGVDFNIDLFWSNFNKVVKSGIPYYLTFTGMSDESIEYFKGLLSIRFSDEYERILEDSFKIQLIEYEALK